MLKLWNLDAFKFGIKLNVELTWLLIRVIMPRADMYDSRDNTCVTPALSILKRFIVQFPCSDTRNISKSQVLTLQTTDMMNNIFPFCLNYNFIWSGWKKLCIEHFSLIGQIWASFVKMMKEKEAYCRDGIHKSISNLILAHLADNVKLGCSWLGDGHVCNLFQLETSTHILWRSLQH